MFFRVLIASRRPRWWHRLLSLNSGVLLSIGGVVLLWVGLLHAAAVQHDIELQEARHDTQNLARAFEETTARTLRAVDQSLLFLRDAYRHDPGGFNMAEWSRDTQSITDITFQVARIDRNGLLATSNFALNNDRIDLSDRDHFRAQRDTPADRLFISKPVLGRVSHRWSIQLTRKILAADGSFDGVFVVSIDPEYLSRFFDRVDLGRGGMVMLVGTDGVVRAAAFGGHSLAAAPSRVEDRTVDAAELGRTMARGALSEAIGQGQSGTMVGESGIDAVTRVQSYRRIEGLPLAVAVGRAVEDVLANSRDRWRRDAGIGALLTLLLASIAVVLWQRETVLLQARQSLVASERRLDVKSRMLETTLEAMSQGIVMVDADHTPQIVNRRAMELLGLEPGMIEGRALLDDMAGPGLDPDPQDRAAHAQALVPPAHLPERVTERRLGNGTVLEVRTRALPDGGAVQTYTDITARAAAEEMLGRAAGHDLLTGLVNRNGFGPKLEQALAAAQRLDQPLHVLCLDLDEFKRINDTHGHAVGDVVLKSAAGRMRAALRASDLVARLGGDEFVVVLTGQSAEGAGHVAQILIEVLGRPFSVLGEQLRVGASIGISSYPADGASAELLLRTADVALYQAKSAGGDAWRAYAAGDGVRERLQASMHGDFRAALDSDAFTLAYQPICDAVTGEPFLFEALVRWDHPTRGPISPAEFIPIAEETGLITRLSRWVIETACAEAALWPHAIGLSINLSPTWFHSADLVDHLRAALAASGLAATRLALEVTEGVLLQETVPVVATMEALRRMGVSIVLDDFGSAHASLSYLRGFPFDLVKIDRSFMQALNTDRQARALVEAMLAMAHALGLAVVAEGVETPEQLTMLRHMSCDWVQGYLLGAPMPGASVAEWLLDHDGAMAQVA